MRPKVLLFIALSLALVQGMAAEFPSGMLPFGIGELPSSPEELVVTQETSTKTGGTTSPKGDVNGDGFVTIADVTEVVDIILEGSNNLAADVNGDNMITVADLTELIDIILGISDARLCTYLIVALTDGSTNEYPIDEYTRVRIAKPDLIIQLNGQTLTYPLNELSQLRYEERTVTVDYKAATCEYLIPSVSETLNSLLP